MQSFITTLVNRRRSGMVSGPVATSQCNAFWTTRQRQSAARASKMLIEALLANVEFVTQFVHGGRWVFKPAADQSLH